jgi:hypothetical protein
MLHIADVIEHETGLVMQFRQFLRQAQVAFSGQQPLHQLCRRCPQDRVPLLHQVIGYCSQEMTFSPSIRMPS